MLREVFYWVFNMSIAAAITGVPVLLLRTAKKLPGRFRVFLWAIPFLRMVLPLGLNSPYSLMSLLSKITARTVVVYQPAEELSFSIMNFAMAANAYFPITYKAAILENIFHVASVIWCIAAVAILLLLARIYGTTVHALKDATPLRDNIYLSDKIDSPGVYGILKPRILLPASYKDRELRLVLLHEQAHIRSLDNLWRVIGFVIAALHWFNPLGWLFLKSFLADLELACDERVLAGLGAHRAKEYALALLETKSSPAVFVSPFGGAKLRTRIENILSFRKLTWLSLAVFALLIAVISYVLLTNPG